MSRAIVLLPACLLLLSGGLPARADDMLRPTYPSVPPDYSELQAHSLVANAKVNFPAYYIDWTNGYKVTAPSGAQFVVDSITQPRCAFYGTYVDNSSGTSYWDMNANNNNALVNSNVYVGEVNFDKCQ